jgi:hypothetical protein
MRLVNICSLAWVLVFLGSLKLMETYGDESLTVSAVALAAAALAWVPVVWAYLRYLREADELIRMIHVQAMAVAFCAGFCVVLLDRFLARVVILGQSPLAAKLLEVASPMVMVFTFTATLVILQWRYSR